MTSLGLQTAGKVFMTGKVLGSLLEVSSDSTKPTKVIAVNINIYLYVFCFSVK